jgi:dTMP kinase
VKPGLFITFEGGEGSGKSTQARLLADRLRKMGRAVVHTREPGGTSIAESVRRVLLNPSSRVAPLTELMLYEAARAQHLAEVVTPALAAGKIVVCERYTDATEAYQGFGRRLDLKKIRVLNSIATDGLRPDRTFLLDVPVGQGLSAARGLTKRLSAGTVRAAAGGDRIERESAAFHERVRRGYLALARRDKKRICVIAWGLSIDDVHGRILQELAPLLHGKRNR